MNTDDNAEVKLDAQMARERRTLRWVLWINIAQAIVVGFVGFVVDSASLVGVALDNAADGGVYALSLYAVGRTLVAKSRAARVSGVLLIALALSLLAEVIRRFIVGAEPVGIAMIVTASANAAVNVICLRLLRAHRNEGVHLKASWIFTSNDMLANAGIALSGAAVMFFRSPLPDLIIGLVVVAIAVKGGLEILEHARDSRSAADPETDGAQR